MSGVPRLTWHAGSVLPFASLWHTVHRVAAINSMRAKELPFALDLGGRGPLARRADLLFNEPNTAVMVSRQLIQRLVSSNPTPDYIERVANVAGRARGETEALAQQAGEAARGQAVLEGSIHQLGEVTAELQRIARHFDVDA